MRWTGLSRLLYARLTSVRGDVMFRGGGGYWRHMRNVEEQRPTVTRALLFRILGYARPWRRRIALMLFLILVSAALSLITPLILRDLIDHTLPARDAQRLHLMSALLVTLPLLMGGLRLWQRKLNAVIAEGLIYDCLLYTSPSPRDGLLSRMPSSA